MEGKLGKKPADKLVIIGGGQLGAMITEVAVARGVKVAVLDKPGVSAAQAGASLVEGAINNPADVRKIAELFGKDTPITIEVEHVAIDTLAELEDEGYIVNPSPETMKMVADKLVQKKFLKKHGIPVADFKEVTGRRDIFDALDAWSDGMIIKARHGGFDGRGNRVVRNYTEAEKALKKLGGDIYLEKLVPFEKEVAALFARDVFGQTSFYPIVETIHVNNICDTVIAPARISVDVKKNAEDISQKTGALLKGAGVFAIEMFVLPDGNVVVNEIAPRVHNSGHLTIEAAATSQFENHFNAVTGRPLGPVDMVVEAAVMKNILRGTGTRAYKTEKNGNAHIHFYGKKGQMPPDKERKIGHVTVTGESVDSAIQDASDIHRSTLVEIGGVV